MKTKIVYLVIGVLLIIAGFVIAPLVSKGMKLNKLENLKEDYARCEQVLKDSHLEADTIRYELGLIEEAPAKKTEIMGSIIDGTQTE